MQNHYQQPSNEAGRHRFDPQTGISGRPSESGDLLSGIASDAAAA
jgi:hypothetical protein